MFWTLYYFWITFNFQNCPTISQVKASIWNSAGAQVVLDIRQCPPEIEKKAQLLSSASTATSVIFFKKLNISWNKVNCTWHQLQIEKAKISWKRWGVASCCDDFVEDAGQTDTLGPAVVSVALFLFWNTNTNTLWRVLHCLLDLFYKRGRVYKSKFCLFVCLSVRHHFPSPRYSPP